MYNDLRRKAVLWRLPMCNIDKWSSEKPTVLRECRRCHNLRLVPEGSVLLHCFIVMSTRRIYGRPRPTHICRWPWFGTKYILSLSYVFEWQFSVDLGSTADGPMILCISVFMFKALTPCRHAELGSIFALNLCAFKGSLLKYSSFVIFDALQTKFRKTTPVAYRLWVSVSIILYWHSVTRRESLVEKIWCYN